MLHRKDSQDIRNLIQLGQRWKEGELSLIWPDGRYVDKGERGEMYAHSIYLGIVGFVAVNSVCLTGCTSLY